MRINVKFNKSCCNEKEQPHSCQLVGDRPRNLGFYQFYAFAENWLVLNTNLGELSIVDHSHTYQSRFDSLANKFWLKQWLG